MKKKKLLIKVSNFIVNLRYLFLCLFIIFITICSLNIHNVKVNYDITSYLPNSTETKKGLELMQKEFGQLNSMQLMITNISYEDALKKVDSISKLDHVKNISFDNNDNYYQNHNALIVIQLDDITDNERNNIKEDIIQLVDKEEYYLYVENGTSVVKGVNTILALVIGVIILVLLITSHSYFNLLLAAIIFSISILLNMGSNYLLGEISYITSSIAIVLQLGLSLDYLIIFLNHYHKEIDDTRSIKLAVKKTLIEAIPEILASSLTTISGLMALIFMQLRIGGDIGIVMSKGIICSMLTVILLLPCLVIFFHKIILKLRHRNFFPDVTRLSKVIIAGRKILLPLFLLIVVVSLFLIPKYDYAYNMFSVKSHSMSEEQIVLDKIDKEFGMNNRLVLIVKNDNKDYHQELLMAQKLLLDKKILSVTNIGNTKIDNNIYLGSSINYQELASLFNIELQTSNNLYQMYATEKNEEFKLNDMDNYHITVIDWIYFLYEHQNELPLSDEFKSKINVYYDKINSSITLLESEKYSRFIIEYKGSKESEDTFKLIDIMKEDVKKNYSDVTMVGESISARDLKDTFSKDNLKITFVTVLFIVIILLFTFKSIGMTCLLVLTIEGSILINFGLATLMHNKIFFISYIIVSAIQMGATIDYAIVMASRYQMLRTKLGKQNALIGALKDSLPAIITSGLILMIAGFLIGYISDSGVVASIGMFLGIGTLISMICTIFVLPSILYAFDRIIRITTFKKNKTK